MDPFDLPDEVVLDEAVYYSSPEFCGAVSLRKRAKKWLRFWDVSTFVLWFMRYVCDLPFTLTGVRAASDAIRELETKGIEPTPVRVAMESRRCMTEIDKGSQSLDIKTIAQYLGTMAEARSRKADIRYIEAFLAAPECKRAQDHYERGARGGQA